MTSDTVRRIAADYAAHSAHAKVAEIKRRRKRATLKTALRRIRDEPSALLGKFRGGRPRQHGARPMKKSGLLLAAGALSVAAGSLPLDHIGAEPMDAVVSIDAQNIRMDTAKLNASDDLKRALLEEEGVRYTVYRDVAGYPTVGVGHLVTAQDNLSVGDTITTEQALAFLDHDIKAAEEGAQKLAGDTKFNQHEFDALVDLVYNVGIGTVGAQKSPELNAAIDAADYHAIAQQLDYRAAGGATYKGLEHRSDRRASIFMDGNYANPRDA